MPTMENTQKNPVGRPTKYEEWMCEDIIKRSKLGQNILSIAGEWDVTRQVLYDWTKAHKDFLYAYTRARECFIGWVLSQTAAGMTDKNFNDRAARLLLGYFDKFSDIRSIKTNGLKTALEEKNYAKACGIVAEQADKGAVTADEFSKLMGGVGTAATAHKTGELDERMHVLEDAIESNT